MGLTMNRLGFGKCHRVLWAALIAVACGKGDTPVAPSPVPTTAELVRTTEQFTYSFTLQRNGYNISGPKFTTKASGPIDVSAAITPVPGFSFGLDLLYLGLATPHNEGNGGPTAIGAGPTISGKWQVTYVGEFQTRIYPANAGTLPLNVPSEGVLVPVIFTVTHP
jgi:hypothetical protein